jgi:hypothetical protein
MIQLKENKEIYGRKSNQLDLKEIMGMMKMKMILLIIYI